MSSEKAPRGKGGKFLSKGNVKRIANFHKISTNRPAKDHNEENEKIHWDDGRRGKRRRVVELGVLAEGLRACTTPGCAKLLNLENVLEESRICMFFLSIQ